MATRAWAFVKCNIDAIKTALGGKEPVFNPITMKKEEKPDPITKKKNDKPVSMILHLPFPIDSRVKLSDSGYHGVACAVAIIGVLFRLKVPEEVGFFGEIDLGGNLLKSLSQEPAHKSNPQVWNTIGLKRFLLPPGDAAMAVKQKANRMPKGMHNLDVVGCVDMFKVIQEVFGEQIAVEEGKVAGVDATAVGIEGRGSSGGGTTGW